MDEQIIASLREFYDGNAEERDEYPYYPSWKREERQEFLARLQQEGKTTLLEIGAGPGRDGLFFQEQGLHVISTDLSPQMVKRCQQKGLTAYVMDFFHLDFPPQSFDAIFSLNCLLHVSTRDLPTVLQRLHELLKPTGLFYLGVYGGIEREGTFSHDPDQPGRFFAYHTDEYMHQAAQPWFEILCFKSIPVERDQDMHFQSMVLRKRSEQFPE